MVTLIYNEDQFFDLTNLLAFINQYTKDIGLEDVYVNENVLESVIRNSQHEFPHKDGIEKASPFKKVAFFVCFFVAERPVISSFSSEIVSHEVARLDNHQNAIIALEIAIQALHKCIIYKKNDAGIPTEYLVENEISLSKHSNTDIIDALCNVTPSTSWKLVTVLLEQLVYKTNPDCQYSK